MDPSKPSFATVRVVSEGEDHAVVEVVSKRATWLDAARDAEKKPGQAVLIGYPDASLKDQFELPLAKYPTVERAVYEKRRHEEANEAILVCAWDRKFAHPVPDQVVSFTVGRDNMGNPEPDRVARPYGSPVADRASRPAWTVIECFDTLEPAGRSLAAFDTRKEAVAYAEQVRQELAREARREYDLSRENFGRDMRQIANQYHERTLARDGEGSHQMG
jgi:hypothetical protein